MSSLLAIKAEAHTPTFAISPHLYGSPSDCGPAKWRSSHEDGSDRCLAYTLRCEKEKLKRWPRAAAHLRERLMRPAAQKNKGV